MNVIFLLNIFLIGLIIFACLFLILSKNPIYSVLFLILIFFCSAFILILFQIDFLGILLLIIYVGAIAVLFLFVIMMLDLKYQNFSNSDVILIFSLILATPFVIFHFIYNSTFLSFLNKTFKIDNSSFSLFDSFNNIDVFGQGLYNYFVPIFLIIGLVLLVAMLGAIILTLKFNLKKNNNELVSKKLSRTSTFLSFFI